MIKVLIADDEPLARQELNYFINEDKGFEVVFTVGTGTDALQKLQMHSEIQVAFLDIDMPGSNGIEVARGLVKLKNPPLIVFATAYHQYAVEAFQANAIDYILKPYDPKLIKESFKKIKKNIEMKESFKTKLEAFDQYLEREVVDDPKRIVGHKRNQKEKIFIRPKDVYYFYAKYADVIAVLKEEELVIPLTLKELTEKLDPACFVQTHKSYIVNLAQIEKIAPVLSSNFDIYLRHPHQTKIPLSRRFAKSVKSALANL